MFRPTYRYTTKLVHGLLGVENARAVVDVLALPAAAARDLQAELRQAGVDAFAALDSASTANPAAVMEMLSRRATGAPDQAALQRLQAGLAETPEGSFRTDSDLVYDPAGRDIQYVPPDGADVPGLVGDLLTWVGLAWERVPAVILAGIAVQELAMIRPFEQHSDAFALLAGDLILGRRGYGMSGCLWPEIGLAQAKAGIDAARTAAHTPVYTTQTDFTPWLERFVDAALLAADQARDAVLQRSPAATGKLAAAAPDAPLYLRDRQRQALEFIRLNGAIRSGQYQELVHVVPDTARRDFMDLLDKGLIVTRGVGRGTHYVLSARGSEEARRSRG